MTFDRHPASVVRPESAPKLLCDLDQRLELLDETGIDSTLVLAFDEPRSKEPAEDFVREVLAGALAARVVVVGDDFHFGHQRQGNVALLRRMGAELDFEVVGLDLVGADHRPAEEAERVSSTAIRAALAAGDLASATDDARSAPRGARHGGPRRRARPRAGLPHGQHRRPRRHLPAGRRHLRRLVPPSRRHRPPGCALVRPATDVLRRTPRPHCSRPTCWDFDGELYGEPARVRFVARLRDERKFESVDALVAQMGLDCDEARPPPGIARAGHHRTGRVRVAAPVADATSWVRTRVSTTPACR